VCLAKNDSILVLILISKRISGLSGMGYPERLAHLGLESLQVRRLKCDLLMCHKIIHCKVVIHDWDFLVFQIAL